MLEDSFPNFVLMIIQQVNVFFPRFVMLMCIGRFQYSDKVRRGSYVTRQVERCGEDGRIS